MCRRTIVAAITALACGFIAAACTSNPPPSPVPAPPEKELTLGLVQREVRAGSSGAEVLAALGSPNQVTRDAQGREVWVYDRVSSERTETVESGSVAGVMAGSAGTVSGAAAGHATRKNTKESTSQKTLTAVIRFDADARVTAVTVNATRF